MGEQAGHDPTNIAEPIRHLAVPIGSVHPYPGNPRTHDLPAIAASLANPKRGQYKPITVNRRTGDVLAGNGTWEAARDLLGWTQIAVTWVDVDDATAAGIVAVDNRTSDLAGYDDRLLADLLGQVDDLASVGYTAEDLDALLRGLDGDGEPGEGNTDPDDVPETPAGEPVTRPGDLWLLGDHRVYCGDSTAGAIAAVLDGRLADCVWTDPPYGVAYVGKTKEALTIENDAGTPGELRALLHAAFTAAVGASRPGAPWYVAAPPGPLHIEFAAELIALGVYRQTLVWVKDQFVLGHSDYHYRHEPIFYGWTPGAAHRAPERRDLDSVWEIPRPRQSKEHPTMKPVGLVTRALDNSTGRGGVVLDPFGGSGTTLIAAQTTGRVAVTVELDPKYCDVICRRWQEFSGIEPVHADTGDKTDFTATRSS